MSDFFLTFNGGVVLGLAILLPIVGIVSLVNYIRRRRANRHWEKERAEMLAQIQEWKRRRGRE